MIFRRIALMLLIICFSLSVEFIVADAQAEYWSVKSPDGRIEMLVRLDNGDLKYKVLCDGNEVVKESTAGIITTDADFSSELEFVGAQSTEINETYTMTAGKAAVYENNCSELKLTFSKNESEMDFYIRAYNDGAAFRYGLRNDSEVIRETTDFTFSKDLTASFMEYERAYENLYKTGEINSLAGTYAMPFLVWNAPDLYTLILEADLNGSYCGSALNSDGSGRMKLIFEPKQTTNVYTGSDFVSPWRVIVIGDADAIANTQMPENLNPPCVIEDTSWIIPGAGAWSWYNGDPTDDPETYKKYIDFASEMGWKYILLDEGWQPSKAHDEYGRRGYEGIYDWVSDVISYANKKNIGIWVWSTWWDLDTPEERLRLDEWAELGIKGVKLDFFDSETQEMLTLMDVFTKECADRKLMVNYHGCAKPTGERRTYPNVLTREAVQGTEHFISGDGWGATADHNCILPFTRNVAGPMDYTPALSTDMGKDFQTDGHRCALPIVFESGIQILSDKPEIYRSSVAYDLFKNIPTSWDRSELISGVPGMFVTMLREKDGIYYIGSICNEQLTEDIRLTFLSDGKYMCEIYYDGSDGVKKRVQAVERNDVITVANQFRGGTALKIYPWQGEYLRDINEHWCYEFVKELLDSQRLDNYFYGDFEPDKPITRAEFVIMMLSAYGIEISEGVPKFTDSLNTFAKNYIYTGAVNNIINGINEFEFAPDAPVLREEAATIIGRQKGLSGNDVSGFADKEQISAYAMSYIDACVKNGIIMGYEDNTFRPQNNITRGEAATMIFRSIG